MTDVFDQRASSGPKFAQKRSLRLRKIPGSPEQGRASPFKRGGRVPHFDLGGLFGGSPGTSSTYQNSTTTNQVTDPNYTGLMDQILGKAGTLANTPFTPYVGPNGETNPMVGLTPQQQQGITAATNNVGNYQPYFNAAGTTLGTTGSGFNPQAGMPQVQQAGTMQNGSQAASPFLSAGTQNFPSAVSQYMSPYTSSVVQGLQDASNRNFTQNTMRTINDTFSGGDAASFGREQHGNAVGNAVYAQGQALDAATANALESGYNEAGTLFNADQNRDLSAGQTAGTLANSAIQTQAGLGQTAAGIQGTNTATGLGIAQGQEGLGAATQQGGITDVNALEGVGAVGQQTNQNQSNFNYNQFEQGIQWPFQTAQAAQGLAQGWQLPTQSNTQSYGTSTVTQPQGSPFGQVLGGALGAASLATPGASGTSALGNIFSGIKGWFSRDGGYLTEDSKQRFAVGGVVPNVGMARRHVMPQMRGMAPTGMPGMPPMAGHMGGMQRMNGQMPQMPAMAPQGPQMRSPFADGGQVSDENPFSRYRRESKFALGGMYDGDDPFGREPIGPAHGLESPPMPSLNFLMSSGAGGGSQKQSGGMGDLSGLLGPLSNMLGGGADGEGLDGLGGIMDIFGSGAGEEAGAAGGAGIMDSLMDILPMVAMAAKRGGYVGDDVFTRFLRGAR